MASADIELIDFNFFSSDKHFFKASLLIFALTIDFLPHMGLHKGVHYMAGCNGAGVAMMTYLGTQTALKILGKANRPCPFDDLPFNSRTFYTGHAWFLPIVSSFYALRDHIDRSRAT